MIFEKTHTLTIQTPEGVHFSLNLAGPVTRFLAWAIDFGVIMVASIFINRLVMIFGVISYDIASAVSIVAYFILSIGYSIILEWFWQGRTLGKRLLRLRVMDVQGLRLRFNQIVIRNLLRFIDSIPAFYLVGGVACLVTAKAQRLGDVAANTIVVRTPVIHEPDLDQILSEKFNSFRNYPHLEARLRQRVTPAQADIALQALLRRDDMDPVARIAFFKDMASGFKRVVEFPEEATDGLSDEQYIRNIVEVLFRKRMTAGSDV